MDDPDDGSVPGCQDCPLFGGITPCTQAETQACEVESMFAAPVLIWSRFLSSHPLLAWAIARLLAGPSSWRMSADVSRARWPTISGMVTRRIQTLNTRQASWVSFHVPSSLLCVTCHPKDLRCVGNAANLRVVSFRECGSNIQAATPMAMGMGAQQPTVGGSLFSTLQILRFRYEICNDIIL